MDESNFTSNAPGRLVPTDGGAAAFVPNDLPPPIRYEPSLIKELSAADRAIGELAGIGRALGGHANPYLLITPFLHREAVLSSRIEGTQAGLEDVFLFPVAERPAGPDDAREVVNYVRAHDHALRSPLPICVRLLREMHEILMTDVRGGDKAPGQFRTRQNWIGAADCRIDAAKFVPPPPSEVEPALARLEAFVHAPGDAAALIRLALVHYQFEVIHPFNDGNGRVGRMLISLMMCRENLLPLPLLCLSGYFEANRDEYASRLFRVSTTGDWDGWIRFFLRGVAAQATDAIARSTRMFELRAEWARLTQTARSSALLVKLVDHLFVSPVVTSAHVMSALQVTRPTALKSIERLVSLGILRPVEAHGRGAWLAARVLEVADA